MPHHGLPQKVLEMNSSKFSSLIADCIQDENQRNFPGLKLVPMKSGGGGASYTYLSGNSVWIMISEEIKGGSLIIVRSNMNLSKNQIDFISFCSR